MDYCVKDGRTQLFIAVCQYRTLPEKGSDICAPIELHVILALFTFCVHVKQTNKKCIFSIKNVFVNTQ